MIRMGVHDHKNTHGTQQLPKDDDWISLLKPILLFEQLTK